jgi:glycosyltransferase involved in cell wall biosynthesis
MAESAVRLRWLLPLHAQSFKLVSAIYGTKEHSADVAQSLLDSIGARRGRLQVSNGLCGCDPHPGCGKYLIIEYELDGQKRTLHAHENGWLFVSDAETSISFMLRCRNEERTLERALTTLECLMKFGISYEIVVILHLCTDQSRAIAENYSQISPVPIRIWTYDLEVSRAGVETYVTDADHERSFVFYSNWCLHQTHAPFVYKWDADFEMNELLAEEIAGLLIDDTGQPLAVTIPFICNDGVTVSGESYLVSGHLGYTKQVFWEVPIFMQGVKYVALKNRFLHNDAPAADPKQYWERKPWFADEFEGQGNVFRRRYNIVKTFHAGNNDMARSCSLNYDRSLVQRLRDITMEQLDSLWQ